MDIVADDLILSLSLSPLGIFGHCGDFPSPPDDGRDLLEVDTVETPDSGHGFAGLAPVVYNATNLQLGVKDTTGSP